MLDDTADVLHLPQRRNVRLDTLLRLRWLAIIGQTTAVLVVQYAIEFPLPIWACLAVIALSASDRLSSRDVSGIDASARAPSSLMAFMPSRSPFTFVSSGDAASDLT